MNKKLDIWKYLPLPLLMLFVIGVLLAFGSSILITPKISQFFQLDDGWSVSCGNVHESEVSLSDYNFKKLKKGDVVTISNTLPTTDSLSPTLMFKSRLSAVDVTVDGEKTYSFGHDFFDTWQFVPKKYHMITLDGSMPHDIRISYKVTEDMSYYYVSSPYYGTKQDLVRGFFQTHRLPLFVGGFFIMYSCILMTLGSFLFLFHEKDLTLFANALTSLLFGVYTYAYNDIFCFVSDHDFLFSLSEYVSLYLIPLSISILLYLTHPNIARSRQQLLLIINTLLPINYMFMRLSGAFRANHVVTLTQAVSVVEILFILPPLISGMKQERKERIRENTYTGIEADTYLLLGFIIMIACILLEIIKFTITKYRYRSNILFNNLNFMTMGALLFIICIFIYYFFNGIDHMNAKYVREQLEGLAYTDALTGLMNRAKYMQYCAALKGPYALVSIDLDRLKSVNDRYGHLEGDKMIRSFSDLVKESFKGASLIARTGGDEFMVAFEDPSDDICDKCIRAMEQKMEEFNRGNEKFTLSASAGYAYSSEADSGKIEDVFFLADSRMYEVKEKHHA